VSEQSASQQYYRPQLVHSDELKGLGHVGNGEVMLHEFELQPGHLSLDKAGFYPELRRRGGRWSPSRPAARQGMQNSEGRKWDGERSRTSSGGRRRLKARSTVGLANEAEGWHIKVDFCGADHTGRGGR